MTPESVLERLDRAGRAVRDALKSPPAINPHTEEYIVIAHHVIHEVFSDDATSGDEASFWVPQEPKTAMTLQTACIKMKIQGIDHVALASHIISSNQRIRTALALGNVSDSDVQGMKDALAEAIFPHYPANYREEWTTHQTA